MLNIIISLSFICIIYFVIRLFFFKDLNPLNHAIFLSGSIFAFSMILLILFDKSTIDPQLYCNLPLFFFNMDFGNLTLFLNQSKVYILQECGIDGLSIFFVLLSTFLIFLCLIEVWNYNASFPKIKEFIIYFFILEFFLILAFVTLDLLVFYIFFESVLIPMFLIIGIWGSRERKIKANFYFFIYTLLGSIFMLITIFIIFFEAYSTKYFVIYNIFFNFDKEWLLLLFSFLAFSVKIPMFPFHIWLPEAHVEAERNLNNIWL